MTDDSLLMALSIEQHLTLSAALCAVMATIEPGDIATSLGIDPETAYEFSYSVYICEAAGRLAGISWLPEPCCADSLALDFVTRPVVAIAFGAEGSIWHMTRAQVEVLQTCSLIHSRNQERLLEVA